MLKRIASILGLAAVVVASVTGCGGDESSQSSDELRDQVITLLFEAAANGASTDGTDPASVVLKALEDNPDLLTSLDAGQLEDLRDALVAPEVAAAESDAQDVAPDTLSENETDMPNPLPDTAGAPGSDATAAPAGGATGGPAGSVISIPTLSVPNINWGAVTDILNSGSSNTSKISIPTATLAPISVPSLTKIQLSDFKIIGRSPLTVTFNITEATADIKTVAYAWTGKGLTGSGDARLVEKVSDTVSTWQVGSMLDNTTALRITVTDRAGTIASFVHQF